MTDSLPQRFLAWDTSSVTGVVCAFEVSNEKSSRRLKRVAEWALSLETSKHSERLLWTIDTVLQSAGWDLPSLSGIAVGVGPGSFTGIRIGMTTAGMLATQLKIPVIPISSLALLARPVADAIPVDGPKTLIIACTDATKGEWFTLLGSAKSVRGCVAMPEGDQAGIWAKGVNEKALTPEELFQEANATLEKWGKDAAWIAVGQSVERYEDLFKALPQKQRLALSPQLVSNLVEPKTLAQLAFEAIQQGIQRDSQTLRPRYLRDSEAEVKLRKGLLKPAPKVC